MEAKGYDVRRKHASNLFKALYVKHQQERAAALAVEDQGDDHAFKTLRTIRQNSWIMPEPLNQWR
jgi:hypothetical protein